MEKHSPPRRCSWVPLGNALYETYHDTEWGIPVYNDIKLFEFLVLEGAQAGLNFLTILKKREAYRECFAGFDPYIIAQFDELTLGKLMKNPGIIRNKRKIASCIHNAKCFLKIQEEWGSFSNYLWAFVAQTPRINAWKIHSEIPTDTQDSQALSRDLKKQGFQFVGPKMMYAYMQAVGMVNDHTTDCVCYKKKNPCWEVYIIECKSGTLYTGITTDVSRRFEQHLTRKKGARFFSLSEPMLIVYREKHPDRSSATKREIAIKKLTRKEKQKLISSYIFSNKIKNSLQLN